MPSPFLGMNPYLEHPELWAGVHHLLISEIAKLLTPQLRPKYRVAVEVRMYETTDDSSLLVGIPDVRVKSRQTATDSTITKVAVAAPTSEPVKKRKRGREQGAEGKTETEALDFAPYKRPKRTGLVPMFRSAPRRGKRLAPPAPCSFSPCLFRSYPNRIGCYFLIARI
jgi:Protein of unknown function (DUF4058)